MSAITTDYLTTILGKDSTFGSLIVLTGIPIVIGYISKLFSMLPTIPTLFALVQSNHNTKIPDLSPAIECPLFNPEDPITQDYIRDHVGKNLFLMLAPFFSFFFKTTSISMNLFIISIILLALSFFTRFFEYLRKFIFPISATVAVFESINFVFSNLVVIYESVQESNHDSFYSIIWEATMIFLPAIFFFGYKLYDPETFVASIGGRFCRLLALILIGKLYAIKTVVPKFMEYIFENGEVLLEVRDFKFFCFYMLAIVTIYRYYFD